MYIKHPKPRNIWNGNKTHKLFVMKRIWNKIFKNIYLVSSSKLNHYCQISILYKGMLSTISWKDNFK